MRGKFLGITAALSTTVLVMTACGGGGGGGAGDNAQGATVTIGLLTSTTGEAAPSYIDAVKGAQGRVDKANAEHTLGATTIKLEIGDDGSSPAGALKAAQDLVQNKKVSAIVSFSSFTYGAYRYLEGQKIPVVGSPSSGGSDWADQDTMFAYQGTPGSKYPAPTTWGDILKSQGVTKLAVIGYGASPSSTASTKNTQASAIAAGIQVPYVNLSIPFGSTDFGSPAVAIKNAGVDGLYASMTSNSNYALVAALKQQGVQLKATALPTGYGQELLNNQTAVRSADGALFYNTSKPVEVNDASTQQWQADLQKYVHSSGIPSFSLTGAWVATDALLAGIGKVQGTPTPESITAGMKQVTNYTANGLLAHPVDFATKQPNAVGTSEGNCVFVVRLEGNKFVVINNGQPYCGTLIPNSNAIP